MRRPQLTAPQQVTGRLRLRGTPAPWRVLTAVDRAPPHSHINMEQPSGHRPVAPPDCSDEITKGLLGSLCRYSIHACTQLYAD